MAQVSNILSRKSPKRCTICGGPVAFTWRNGALGYAHVVPSNHGASMPPPEPNIENTIGPLFMTAKPNTTYNYNLTPNMIQNPMSGPVQPAGIGWTVPGISGGGLSARPMSTSRSKKSIGK